MTTAGAVQHVPRHRLPQAAGPRPRRFRGQLETAPPHSAMRTKTAGRKASGRSVPRDEQIVIIASSRCRHVIISSGESNSRVGQKRRGWRQAAAGGSVIRRQRKSRRSKAERSRGKQSKESNAERRAEQTAVERNRPAGRGEKSSPAAARPGTSSSARHRITVSHQSRISLTSSILGHPAGRRRPGRITGSGTSCGARRSCAAPVPSAAASDADGSAAASGTAAAAGSCRSAGRTPAARRSSGPTGP